MRTGRLLTGKPGPVGLALAAWEIWRRLPKEQRRQILAATRRHGPKVARYAAKRFSDYRRARPKR